MRAADGSACACADEGSDGLADGFPHSGADGSAYACADEGSDGLADG
jgi:hypothetical protein